MCTGLAAMQTSGGNGANTAGGISGSNNAARQNPAASGWVATATTPGRVAGPPRRPASAPAPAPAAPTRAWPRPITRSAQQRNNVRRKWPRNARAAEALKSCLDGRGYQEFALTAGAARASRHAEERQQRISRVSVPARQQRRSRRQAGSRAREVVRRGSRRTRPSTGGRLVRTARFRATGTTETTRAFPRRVPPSGPPYTRRNDRRARRI